MGGGGEQAGTGAGGAYECVTVRRDAVQHLTVLLLGQPLAGDADEVDDVALGAVLATRGVAEVVQGCDLCCEGAPNSRHVQQGPMAPLEVDPLHCHLQQGTEGVVKAESLGGPQSCALWTSAVRS